MSIFARGGVEFRVNGEKIVKESEAFLLTHPVNSYYITDDYDDNPIIKYGGDWKRIEAGRVLWSTTTDGEGGSLVEAGLPNLKGQMYELFYGQYAKDTPSKGVFSGSGTPNLYWSASSGNSGGFSGLYFNANNSSGIYKDNVKTVQPPAVKVYIWKRVG